MIVGTFYIIGLEDVQQDMLMLSPKAVTVTAYNEQKTPLSIRLNHLTGAQSEELKAFIRLRIMSADLELGQHDFGLCSEASYTLPQGKWGNASRIIVEAFSDEAKQNLITSDEVSILAENPTPFPLGKPWGPGERYKNGEYLLDGNIVYMWRNRVTGNTLTSPSKVTVSDPFYGSWERYEQWAVLATMMMLAKSALIGSSVFDGDYTISQHGQSKGTNPETGQPYDYRDFDAAMSKFIPNFMIDWLRGKVVGMDMEIKGGKIGGLTVKDGKLIAEYPTQGIEMDVFGSGPDTLRFGSLASELISIRLNNDRIGRRATGIDMDINGDSDRGLAIVANGTGSFCIDNAGSHRFYQRKGDVWDAPGILYAGHFNGKGHKLYEWGQGAGEVTCNYEGKGSYRINHQVNKMDYFVTIMPYTYWAYATVQGKDDKTFSFTIVDNGQGGLMDLGFDVMIFGRNIFNDYSPQNEQ